MDNVITQHLDNTIKYCSIQFDTLIKEGKIEWTNDTIPDYDVKNWDKETYEKVGYFSGYSFQYIYRRNVRNITKGSTISDFILKNIKKEQFYIDFIELLKETYGIRDIEYINKFHKNLFKQMVYGDHEYEYNFKTRNFEILTKLIQKGKALFSKKHMVSGLSCSEVPISINIGDIEIIIKRPDIKEFIKYSEKLNIPLQQFSCWIEFETVNQKTEYWKFDELLIRPLRLFKLGSIFSLGSYIESYDGEILSKFNSIHHKRNYYNYKITKNDEKQLENFYNKIFPKIYELSKLKLVKRKKQEDIIKYSLQVAIERFEEISLEVNNGQDKRVAFAIMGLEALYNSDNDKETIGFKLKLRVAKTLRNFGFDSIDLAKSISKAYGIRSAYAHGSATLKDISFDFEEKIIEYLRISILIFLNIDIMKSKFIQLINESFYNEIKDKEFRKLIEKIKNNMELNINKKFCP